MKSKKILGFLMILMMMGNLIMMVTAQENESIIINDTQDDGFITEVGLQFDSSLVTMIDPNMDIRSFVVFENLDVNSWEPVTNATLRLTSSATLPFDNDSSIVVFGMNDELGANGSLTTLSTSEIIMMPLTANFVEVNTSQFFGGATIDINVTSIVTEIVNRPFWSGDGFDNASVGNDIGFTILGEPDDQRHFYDFLGDPARSANLTIFWNHAPPPPPGDVEFNETYRDLNIWVIDHLGPNRTGVGTSLNWSNLNMTELTEIDSGASLTLNNDTWVTISNLQAQEWDSFYNDTGSTNIDSALIRFGFNVTAVTNALAGSDRVMSVASLSTASPVGGGGLGDGGAGDWVGLVVFLNADDLRWRFRLMERSGALADFGTSGPLKTEGDGAIYYGEFTFKDVGAQNWIAYRVFSDPGFTQLIETDIHVTTQAAGSHRYGQVSSSLANGLSRLTGEFYTFLDFTLAENATWIVTFPNGTVIGNATTYPDAIIIADDLLGPDPQDPDPPSQGWPSEGPFTRFRMRFYIFLLGVGLLWGPVMVFAWRRPTGHELIVGIWLMTLGLGLIIHAGVGV